MRQKLITLDPTSFEIASKIPNFSEWVRTQLRLYRDNGQTMLQDVEYLEGEIERWTATAQRIAAQRDLLISKIGEEE